VTDGGKGWSGTLNWIETFGGSSLPGRVNYKHFFKNVSIFDHKSKSPTHFLEVLKQLPLKMPKNEANIKKEQAN
jgi:hypothetical protein